MFDQATETVVEALLQPTPAPVKDPRYDTDEGKIFRGAYDLIKDEKQWCVGYLYKQGAHCALGAVHRASRGDHDFPVTFTPEYMVAYPAAEDAVMNALYAQIPDLIRGKDRAYMRSRESSIAKYNNAGPHAKVKEWFEATGKANGWL